MRNNDYIKKAKSVILNRVRFHAPVVYDDDIDKTVLFVNGIDISKPIFKFDKVLNKNLVKAFSLALKEEKFNILFSNKSVEKVGERKLKKIPNAILYNQEQSSVSFIEMINKLNINYSSPSNYNIAFKDKFFKVNEIILNPSYKEFVLRQNLAVNEVWVEYSEFVLNGRNIFVNLKNKANVNKKIELELNIPLRKGYYFFKQLTKSVLVENLLTKEKKFLNFFARNCKFSFSNVDGLENSVFCCVNVRLTVNIEKKEEKIVFFNFGDEKFAFNNSNQIKSYKQIALKKCCEIFNVKVKTKETKFDNYFNNILPKKIWINWLNDETNLLLEEKYLNLKKLFIRGCNNFSFVPFREIGIKEIGLFNGEYYKKVEIVSSSEKFLKLGKTFFYNMNGISKESLKKSDPIMLSFGD